MPLEEAAPAPAGALGAFRPDGEVEEEPEDAFVDCNLAQPTMETTEDTAAELDDANGAQVAARNPRASNDIFTEVSWDDARGEIYANKKMQL